MAAPGSVEDDDIMARIAPLERTHRSLLLRGLNWLARRRYGQEVDSLNIVARAPAMLVPYIMASQLGHANTALAADTRALAMHLVASQNGCAWCMDFGLSTFVREGVSLEKLQTVADYATDERFSEAERAALAYADVVTAGTGQVSDAVFDALRPHFSEREIVELTVSIAIENFYNRINGPLQIDAQSFCTMPTVSRARSPRPASRNSRAVA